MSELHDLKRRNDKTPPRVHVKAMMEQMPHGKLMFQQGIFNFNSEDVSGSVGFGGSKLCFYLETPDAGSATYTLDLKLIIERLIDRVKDAQTVYVVYTEDETGKQSFITTNFVTATVRATNENAPMRIFRDIDTSNVMFGYQYWWAIDEADLYHS